MNSNIRAERASLWLSLAMLALASHGSSVLAQDAPAAVPGAMTYSNLASQALLKRAQEISRALTDGGFLPAESFTNVTVDLEGQSTHPSARVKAGCCEYWFREGSLHNIRRRDLFEDKGPASLILQHLTNEVLTLKPDAVAGRALDMLRRLSYPANRIRQVCRFSVHDDLMIASPIRNGGPNFPKDLHYFGELISRKKIKIGVGMGPADLSTHAEPGTMSSGPQIYFLATTGELLEAWLPDSAALAQLGGNGPEQITIPLAVDFAPPLFFSVTQRLAGAETTASKAPAAALVRSAWNELQQKLGTNQPKCLLLCDNLNDPEAVVAEMRGLAGDTPWVGLSHFFRLDLPFDRSEMEPLAQDKRGVSLLAICGRIETRLEVLSGLDDRQTPRQEDYRTPEGRQKSERLYEQERQRLAPGFDDLFHRLRLPEAFPDHAAFLLQPRFTYPADRIAESEFSSRFWGKAKLDSLMGGWGVGDGITYFNGKVLTNTIAILAMSGFLPLEQDVSYLMALRLASLTNSPNFDPEKLRRLQSRPPPRPISSEATRPIEQLAYAFGPHPLEGLVSSLGWDHITMLQEAEKLEVFEIKPGEFGSPPPAGARTIEGYELVAQGKTLGRDAAHEFASALLIETTGMAGLTDSEWRSQVLFRAWRGNESASVAIFSGQVIFDFYDASGKLTRRTLPPYHACRWQTLLRLARTALPDSPLWK